MASSTFSDSSQMKILLQGLNKYRKAGILCDVTLRIAGKGIYAHSNVLSGASSYFASVLGVNTGDADTADSDRTDTLTLEKENEYIDQSPQVIAHQVIDMKIEALSSERILYCEALEKLVDYIYSGDIVVTKTHVGHILQLAKLLGLTRIIIFCERFNNSTRPKSLENASTSGIMFIDVENEDFKCTGTDIVSNNNNIRKACTSCNFVGRTKRELRDHRHSEHLVNKPPPGVNKCTFCNSEFDDKKSLILHKKIHFYEAPSLRYPCHACSKKFRWRWELRKHCLTHSQSKPFECSLCGEFFKTIQTLNHHELLHQRKDLFVGTELGHVAVRKVQYFKDCVKTEDRNHKKDKHLCVLCGRMLKNQDKYLRHMDIVHPKGKEYICYKCGYCTADTAGLTSHLLHKHSIGLLSDQQHVFISDVPSAPSKRPHRNKGRFLCVVCSKVFDMKQNLKRHLSEVHNTDRPYQCPECDFSTKRNEYLKNHMRFTHKILSTSPEDKYKSVVLVHPSVTSATQGGNEPCGAVHLDRDDQSTWAQIVHKRGSGEYTDNGQTVDREPYTVSELSREEEMDVVSGEGGHELVDCYEVDACDVGEGGVSSEMVIETIVADLVQSECIDDDEQAIIASIIRNDHGNYHLG